MSLLDLFARHSAAGRTAVSLPDMLAAEALGRIAPRSNGASHALIAEHFAATLVQDTPKAAKAYVGMLREHGVSADRLVRRIVPATADILGKAWENDTIDFAQITHASGQLMQVLRECIPLPPLSPYGAPVQPRILLSRTPGEDHVVGLLLLALDMRRQGWLVRIDLSGELAATSAIFNTSQFDAVGFTAAGVDRAPAMREMIALTRRAQPLAKVMIGGFWAGSGAAEAAALGADLCLGRVGDPVAEIGKRFNLHTEA